ncbi:hypothetical protein [Streptomyces sp. Wb2n-11]|nr:hypothetical protein [Streptomyces sp. Wb2n-11]
MLRPELPAQAGPRLRRDRRSVLVYIGYAWLSNSVTRTMVNLAPAA